MNSSKLLVASLLLSACGDDPVGSLPDAAVAPVAQLDVAVTAFKVPILQGTATTVAVKVTRFEGLTGAVEITPVGLPPGVTADPLTIAAHESTGTLTLRATPSAAHSRPTQVQVRGQVGATAATTPITVTVCGTPGSLDTSFAGGGKLRMPAGAGDDYAYATAAQADGKILVAGRAAERLGDFSVIRLDLDGNLDPSYGNGGRVLTDFAGASETIYAVALQPDGKLVAAGVSTANGSADFAVARYNTDGTLDQAFGTGGKVTTPLSADADTAYAVLVQPDGKIVVGGDSNRGTANGLDFALVRYTPAGALDQDFGDHGIALTSIAPNGARDSIYALTLQQDGKIIAAGGEGDFTVVRYLANGQVDSGFGTNGHIANIFGSTIGAAHAITISQTGAIVVAGSAQHDFAVAQLTDEGQLDPGFGTGGKVTTAVSAANDDQAQAITIDWGGKYTVAGWVWDGNSSAGNFVIVRYFTNGNLDRSFGGTGIVTTAVAPGTKADQAMAIAIQHDERVIVDRIITAGYASDTNSDFAVTRYWR